MTRTESSGERLEFSGWATLLEELRKDLHRPEVELLESTHTRLKQRFSSTFPLWGDQLWSYNNEFSKDKPLQEDHDQKEKKKKLILETRAALRYGLLFLSLDDSVAEVRRTAQNEAVSKFQWHLPLGSILSQKRGGDSKCRAMAAQILCNLVTANFESSTEVASTWPLSPSSDEVRSRIVGSLSSETTAQFLEQKHETMDMNTTCNSNWVDMILFSARNGNREAVGGIVAALHNCICSLQQQSEASNYEASNRPPLPQFIQELGSNSMLISTLLRHFISLEDVNHKNERQENEHNVERGPDAATQWIHLLFAKLSRLGTLPEIHKASGGEKISNTVVPEQVVLLHCLRTVAAEASLNKPESKEVDGNPFGGEMGWEGLSRSHEFLANLFSEVQISLFPTSSSTVLEAGEKDEADFQLMASAGVTILEILSESLGMESPTSEQLRQYLGTKTLLLQMVSQVLASLVDTLSARSFGRKPRELQLSKEEQQLITVSVRLLGNLCFRCRHNQDLMRLTQVPVTPIPLPPSSLKDQAGQGTTANGQNEQRTALHALLSCTSFGHGCFTLREWSVVAIRNVLDKNDANQEEVTRLEAQQPMDTAELQKAGVRVSIDGRGKVSVAPDKIN